MPLLHLPNLTHPLKTLDNMHSPPSPFKGQTSLSKFMKDFLGWKLNQADAVAVVVVDWPNIL